MVVRRISFIVPTHNSARTIGRCLESLQSQASSDIEIIVVDNGSEDQTWAIASPLADTLVLGGPERSAQRNRGAELSTGDVLVFVDSDMRAEPGLAAEIARRFSDPHLAAAVVPEFSFGENFWAWCKALEKRLYAGNRAVEADRVFRRDAFQEVGGYDVTLTGAEDWDLPDRIRGRGLRTERLDTPIWHDEGAPTLHQLMSKKHYYSSGVWAFASKQPRQAARRLFRISLFRRPGLLVRQPLLAGGLLVIKLAEAVGMLAGLAKGCRTRHVRVDGRAGRE